MACPSTGEQELDCSILLLTISLAKSPWVRRSELQWNRRWVCKRCIQSRRPTPRSFAEKGIQNVNDHLFTDHGICAPAEATKSSAQKKAEKSKTKVQKSIADVMKPDVTISRERDVANNLVKGFDRKHF
jgi:hypothetical protein